MSWFEVYVRALFTRKVRMWLYGLVLAGAPLLAFLGVIDPAVIPFVLPFALALLNLSPDEVDYESPERVGSSLEEG